ncbi:hypothetical protein CJD36_014615 [Flavipsychrobacter stenotrophus]|uniref:Sensor of ECF-type sigma factor n=1 Tax=Flavipsychrobacter stenotrophus TaxID=2077091 RepID=A0A2S7ST67_9BACT|nr:hypothetical protein [Flavipsychrobacter stenotrophus]PQJ09934.1 hypothetical protein CJD36_014615 [Flavipsychrobacter stenotrophus]
MKNLLLILALLLTVSTTYAQRDEAAKARIHAAKMAYITDRIHLSATQSGEFIPLYNEYEAEARTARKPYKEKYTKAHPDAKDFVIMQYVADDLDCQQQILLIKKKYQDRFLKIISQQQLSDLNMSEREFKQILLKKLKEEARERRMSR